MCHHQESILLGFQSVVKQKETRLDFTVSNCCYTERKKSIVLIKDRISNVNNFFLGKLSFSTYKNDATQSLFPSIVKYLTKLNKKEGWPCPLLLDHFYQLDNYDLQSYMVQKSILTIIWNINISYLVAIWVF